MSSNHRADTSNPQWRCGLTLRECVAIGACFQFALDYTNGDSLFRVAGTHLEN